MTVCNFFLEGRCRYGDTCWNEHPRGGAGGGGGGGGGGGAGYGGYSRTQQQPSNNRGGGGGGGGGFGNRVWVNPSQKSSGRDYVQSSSFAKSGGNEWGRGGGGGGGGSEWRRGGAGGGGGGSEWGRGGGGERNTKSSNFSFSNQNRFSALDSQEAFQGGSQGDDNEKHVEVICKDMEVWESSGQWPFSCYSAVKASISGFTELSPEELRMEYYSGRASGDLQSYANSVQQLATQWSSRVQELKILTPTTRAALIAELNNPQSAAPGFPTVAASFGAGGFGATGSVVSSGFGSVDPPPAAPTGFGSASSAASFSFSTGPAPVPASFGAGSAPTAASFSTGPAPASFGASSAPTAASFSFSNSASSFAAPPATAAGFSFSAPGFGAPVAAPPPAVGGASFGQPAGGAGPVMGDAQDKLFTPQGELTPEELKEFTGKRFTLGQVPLRPPPAGLLVV